MRKPLRCRLGLHRWYLDSALLCSVERCNDCDAVSDEMSAILLDLERSMWSREK